MKFRLKKWRNDFTKSRNSELWYDINDDWGTIASSLKAQYGYSVREKIETMNWGELVDDISNLMEDTPLRKVSTNKSRRRQR